ncbi:MAG: toxic anion resistance protein, partial [Lachnospiraceae bacterium]|nr:toxic anion resistance protein [Lachnospiraceae bacterium]
MPVVEDGKVVSEVMSAGAGSADQLPALPIEEHLVQNANLSDEELRQVEEFSKQIDITDTAAIINYGVGTQKKLADFSEKTLESVRTKDMGEVGGMVTDLVVQLKNFDVDDEKGGFFSSLFKKGANKAESLKAKYSKVETNVTTITNQLEQHQVTLLKDSEMLDKMYDMNLVYFKELTMYILAG